MKVLFLIVFVLVSFISTFAQNEQAPIKEAAFEYKDWTYKKIDGSGETNLRKFATGKKLVIVVYWAPWCPNWRHDVAFVQQLHEKYAKDGLAVMGVGEYDPVDSMKKHIEQYKLTFPIVYESDNRAQREKTDHYSQRRSAGDTRRWGTPWYVFLEPEQLSEKGKTLANTVNVVNGELIKDDAEAFIREKLDLSAKADSEQANIKTVIEACEPTKTSIALTKPEN